jgi:hypothetical protein
MSQSSPSASASSVSAARWVELKRASRERATARKAREARIAKAPAIAAYVKPGSDADSVA